MSAQASCQTATSLELDAQYFRLAEKAIPQLRARYPRFKGQEIEIELNGSVEEEKENQLAFALAEPASSYGRAKRHCRSALSVDHNVP